MDSELRKRILGRTLGCGWGGGGLRGAALKHCQVSRFARGKCIRRLETRFIDRSEVNFAL